MKLLLLSTCLLLPSALWAQQAATVELPQGLGNYGQASGDAYQLTVPDGFSWPDGTVFTNTTSTNSSTSGAMLQGGKMSQVMTITQTLTLVDASHVNLSMLNKIDSMEMIMADGTKQTMPAPAMPAMELSFTRSEDGKWTATGEGGPEAQAAAAAMGGMADGLIATVSSDSAARALFGTTPRKVGETWKLDTAALQSLFGQSGGSGSPATAGMKMDFSGVSGDATFERVEEHEGESCAVISSTMVGTVTMTPDPNAQGAAAGAAGPVTMKMDMATTSWRSLARPIVLLTESKGKVDMTVMGMDMASDVTSTTTSTVELP